MQDAIKSADPSVATGRVPKIGDTNEGGPPGDVGKAISAGARGAEVGGRLACDMNVQRRMLETSDCAQAETRDAAGFNSVSFKPCRMEGTVYHRLVCLVSQSLRHTGTLRDHACPERRCLTL